MLKVTVSYPNEAEELEIIRRMAHPKPEIELKPVIKPEQILKARQVVDHIYMDEKIERYIVDLIFATRNPEKYKLPELTDLIQFGASPRASINLALAAKAHAFINHRGYVTPDDIRALGLDILRHRVLVTYEAEAENMTSEDIVTRIFETVEVP